MRQMIFILMILAVPAQAFDWPWEQKPLENPSFCRGFAYSGLATNEVKDAIRIQMWMIWNRAAHDQFKLGKLNEQEYEAGKARFNQLLANSDRSELRDAAERECDFGRS
ncbi:MAG: hypothetical protein H6985_07235 [Pseudomonadales bacterium]|nr:hypothetical protein [Halioglobus sp.]MCP5129356.1 hypothetical protein [Pseudomonadales bacterium]